MSVMLELGVEVWLRNPWSHHTLDRWWVPSIQSLYFIMKFSMNTIYDHEN